MMWLGPEEIEACTPHSGTDVQGRTFHVLGIARGQHVWPIEEYLARAKHKPTVAARIRRLNPHGKVEGDKPRGWNPKGPSAQQRKRWMK